MIRKDIDNKGFTLIEVMIAIVLLTIIVTGLSYILIDTIRITNLSQRRVVASNLAKMTLEEQRSKDYESIKELALKDYDGDYSAYKYKVKVRQIGEGVKEVRAIVFLKERILCELVTLVAK